MKRNSIISVVFISVFSLLFLMFFRNPSDDKNEEIEYYSTAIRDYRIFNLKIPENLTFAGEDVPIENFYVRERLERELLAITYWHSRTLLILKRSARYFPVFKNILEKNNIPLDFMFLAMTESELSFPVSPSGAVGMWQFLKKTAENYNLEINIDVDERYHVEKSTQAACDYLNEMYKQFNSWTLSAIAYNMGPTRIPNIIEEQKTNSFYDLVLFEETSRYIYRILAFKIVWQNPKQYGFNLRNKDLYYPIPVKYIEVDTSITNLVEFANNNNTNLLVLKELNPWLRNYSLTNKTNKKYSIAIPKTVNYQSIMQVVREPNMLFNDNISKIEY